MSALPKKSATSAGPAGAIGAAPLALYRKYRPAEWSQVLGQDHITAVLKASVEQSKIFHAYLFAGTRGTGKTSVARLMAQAVGCAADDLYEIDAASNRGIDDIRHIKESVDTLPFSSPYKVYIIDEVHMLTKEAFNALLKTLEEPPRHVIFILATTELEKLPETIVSRCQSFTFKKPTQVVLRDLVLKTAKAEGYELEKVSAELIALLGDGSFRDTHGILQKVISFSSDKKISPEEVELVTGAPSSQIIMDFIGALDAANTAQALAAIAVAVEKNVDMRSFIKLALRLVRAILLMRAAPDMSATLTLELGEVAAVFAQKIAAQSSAANSSSVTVSKLNSRVLVELLTTYEETGRSYIAQLPLELAVMRLGENVAAVMLKK